VQEVALPWEPNPTELAFAAIVADGGAQMAADVGGDETPHHPAFQALLDVARHRAHSAAEWFDVQRRVFELRARVRALTDAVDVLLGPVVAGHAPLHAQPPAGLPEGEYGEYRAFDAVHLIALAGLPAASVPAGWEEHVPVGAQVAAAPFREDIVLAVAAVLERELD
jgi:Asp-tRNA(Asn)/Glu-tRNA(Gln) amidotransferase A subunit family amidase